MDRDFVIKVARQLYGLDKVNLDDIKCLLREYLTEKGKDKDKIDLFIRTIGSIPLNFTTEYYLIALEYYRCKHNIITLSTISSNPLLCSNKDLYKVILVY